ncbi:MULTISPECIES: MFS transporter [Rheinheimera]|uniref:MFS transporter n=1 Tax=Rheinheimera TaxID=67575 RepID=UPI00104CBDB0|nr:MFS transporter [Rheinheimera sp. D18]QBL09651.1 MFS transporter [Rheinheimera sp. D18]
MSQVNTAHPAAAPENRVSYGILTTISASHAINDMMQSVMLALYPVLSGNFNLSFMQIGLITLVYQTMASLLQPFIGRFTDKKPMPFSLPIGMSFTLFGLIILAYAASYGMVLLAAALIGIGSSVFHPESSRIARMASAGKHGLAQSIFQVGGNVGTAIGPIFAAVLILPNGQKSVAWVALLALLGMTLLLRVSYWYSANLKTVKGRASLAKYDNGLSKTQVRTALTLLLMLLFSKFVYLAGLHSYFTFYLIDRFDVSIQTSQYCLFLFLVGVAIGTIAGGPVGDYIGRKRIILGSILGSAPFALMLPFVSFSTTLVLVFLVGMILASAFPAMIVYGQELMPGKIGTVSGLFFGIAFGIAGIGAAAIGALADFYSIGMVYKVCAVLPLLGIVGFWLPELKPAKKR